LLLIDIIEIFKSTLHHKFIESLNTLVISKCITLKTSTIKLTVRFIFGKIKILQLSENPEKAKLKTYRSVFACMLFCLFNPCFGQSAPDFGAAASFILFTTTGAVSNTGTSYITGDVGTNAGAISGFEAPTFVDGVIHMPGVITNHAANDLLDAYNQLHNTAATNTTHVASFGNGETLIPGVYTITNAATINGTLTLDAQGNPNSTFIFRSGGGLSTGATSEIILINGALARNVFWVAEGAIALGASTKMIGTLISNNGAVSLAAASTLQGRMYSTTGAISIDSGSIVVTENGNGMAVSPNQTICSGMWAQDLTLSGNIGSVIKWQRSTNALFTIPIDIASTSTILTSEIIGNLTITTYFRAVVTTGDAIYHYSDYAIVAIYSGNHPDFGAAADFIFFTINGAVGNTGTSEIIGNIGTNIGVISGFESPTILHGRVHNADTITAQASSDLITVYEALQAISATNTTHPAAFGGGEILTAGVYSIITAATVSGTLVLDGQGNQDAQFIFRINGAFSAAVNSEIILINGASSENIFWIAEGAIGIGASTSMRGTLIANNGAVSMGANGTLYGRMYSTGGAIGSNGNMATAVGDGIAGIVLEDQVACVGTSLDDLLLVGNTGTVIKWQKTNDPDFNTFDEINNTNTTLNSASIGMLTETNYFRAVVRKGFCEEAYSKSAMINIFPQSVGGKVLPNQVFCRMGIPTDLTLSENVGRVIKWESASDAAFTTGVTDIASTETTLTSAAIGVTSTTTYFRAIVQSGGGIITSSDAVQILIPLPVTYADGSWNGVPNAKTPIIVESDLNLIENLHVCSCQVAYTAILTIPSGITLTVERDLEVESTANLIVENNGSLMQVDDSGTATGNITVYRNSAPMKLYDYSYWSTPVQNWRLNQLSPNTLSNKFYSWNPIINNWNLLQDGVAIMESAKGYIVRAPQGWSATNESSGVYEGSFTGVSNTGIVPIEIKKGNSTYNLIGNPYPSAINIDVFLEDENNAAVVNGTIYLWTHNTVISGATSGSATYNYTIDDYAKYNLTGGVKTASAALNDGLVPDGIIASGQGFFIEANSALANGSYLAHFNNSMRIAGSNNQFYRSDSVGASQSTEKNRIWLKITNSQGAYNEILIGYVNGATNGFDNLYDGKTFASGNVLSMYSIVEADHYSIQGRALPIEENEMIPLGYQTTIAGTFTIAIENLDGFFQNKDVFLVDKSSNTIQNLKTGNYTFDTAIGTFDDRFELRFTEDAFLNTSNPSFALDGLSIVKNGSELLVKSSNVRLQKIKVYDLTGRLLCYKEAINAFQITLNIDAPNQVLIVSVTSEIDETITKKVL
jgi:hypothetical protein